MLYEITPFQQQLLDAANYMVETQTLSGVNIKEAKHIFHSLVKQAVRERALRICVKQLNSMRPASTDQFLYSDFIERGEGHGMQV